MQKVIFTASENKITPKSMFLCGKNHNMYSIIRKVCNRTHYDRQRIKEIKRRFMAFG